MKKLALAIFAVLFALILNAQNIIQLEGINEHVQAIKQTSASKKLEIEGVYNGKNLFVKNFFGKKGIGYCIRQVNVNGNITTDEINAEIFMINLALHKLKTGDKLKIEIFYVDSCTPVAKPIVMNPTVIEKTESAGLKSLIIQGTNFEQTLLVMNPRSGKGYGIKEVFVNGIKAEGINSDVFELNFHKMGIKYESKIKIEFKFEAGCDPLIINPEVINY